MPIDHEDYLPGEAPAAHKETHENGGVDEVSVAGLAGVSTELAAHILLPTVHQDAPDLILTHKGDADAHHAKYTNAEAEAVADVQIGIHAALPTVHQDAPDLILTHKGDADAHHAKYTNAEAEAVADVQIGIHAALPTAHQDAPDLILTHKGDADAHHAKYTNGDARASINDIFGADGKADADIDMDTHKITGVVDPVNDQEAATKKYVDDHGGGVFQKARAYRANAQNIPADTWTKVGIDTDSFDPSGITDLANHRIIPTLAGYYHVNGESDIYQGSTTMEILIAIFKNGAEVTRGNRLKTGSHTGGMVVTDIIYLNGSTDYIELFVYILVAKGLEIGATRNYLSLVGPF